MSNLPLIGPITVGSSFMLASIRDNVASILNAAYKSGEDRPYYYWETDLSTLLGSSSIPIFSARGTLDSLTLSDSINHGGIALTTNNSIVINSATPETIRMVQSMYSDWYPPDIFLSGVPYTIYDEPGNVAARIYTTADGVSVLANNIIILPVLWYSNCSDGYNIINTPLQSITNWMCLISPTLAGCSGIDLISNGWTNLTDCTYGIKYNYCLAGNTCGDNGCKGPCPVIYDDCSPSNFVCTFNASKFFEDTRWWKSPYFIGLIIAIVLIISVLTIVIIFYNRKVGTK